MIFPKEENDSGELFYNLQRKEILRTKLSEGENLVNLAGLSKGIYMVVVKSVNKYY